MDIFKTPLTVIFKEQNPYKIISNYFSYNNYKKNNHTNLDKERFIYLCENLDKHFSKDEIENLFYIVDDEMENPVAGINIKKSVFNLLLNYLEPMLDDYGDNIRCKYKDLLKWRMTSLKLDQDMLLSAYIAYKDILIGRSRRIFNWDTNIKSNNIRLHKMLSKGLAENHFHLKGSSPTYYLNWVSVMNNIHNRKLPKGELDNNRLEQDLDEKVSINDMLVVAGLLRVILFYSVYLEKEDEVVIWGNGDNNEIGLIEILKRLVTNNNVNAEMVSLYAREINRHISTIKNIFGKDLNYKNNKVKVDYAITEEVDISDKSTRLFSGERSLMYKCFKKIYLNDSNFEPYVDLFYAYIICKCKFRAELIQTNDMVGFANFADYQDRKTMYIPSTGILEDNIASTAILSSIKNQNIVSLEARVSPGNSASANKKYIKLYDDVITNHIYNDKENYWIRNIDRSNYIDGELSISERRVLLENDNLENINNDIESITNKYFYVFHFIKKSDKGLKLKSDDIRAFRKCRHSKYREDIKKQAIALFKLREGNPKIAKRVLGVDAASSELDTRPEVYGQTFRFLKAHLPSNTFYKSIYRNCNIPRLKATYHVGEDFLDVIDGLRAIDEAILFLELTHGDRLGHAIALGIDVQEWYNKKMNRVHLSKHDILDNIAWLIAKLKEFRSEESATSIDKLITVYNKYYMEIYTSNMGKFLDNNRDNYDDNIIPVDTYIEAWKLRGDNPEYHLKDDTQKELNFWDRCAIRNGNATITKTNRMIKELYLNYHYNPKIKMEGNKKVVFKVEQYIIDAVKVIQKEMQLSIMKKGIAIETNPSSNYSISTFKRYDKHPILNLYNLGLTIDENETEIYPQMFVSINTDDQGVFGTLLENEYALMGIALEKAKDKYGNYKYNQAMIYDWLDRIRKMGIEQSFNEIID